MPSPSPSAHGPVPKDWDARFTAEAAKLRLHYCNLFKFWSDCRDKRCRHYRRCCGDANDCLKRRIDEIPRMEHFRRGRRCWRQRRSRPAAQNVPCGS